MEFNVIIIGAGASGLMCAITAGKRGQKVLILEKSNKVGKKILISGGGRCNFGNFAVSNENFLANNIHFCKSALSAYTVDDFISLMQNHNLSYNQKTLGQLFCDQKSPAVVKMLLDEAQKYGVQIVTNFSVDEIKFYDKYIVNDKYIAKSLVIATGGPSVPKIGASDFALNIADKFNIKTRPFTPALVPLNFCDQDIETYFTGFAGVSLPIVASCNGISFAENMLITHKGLSGPAILQISSYWNFGDEIQINLLPKLNAIEYLYNSKKNQIKLTLKTIMSEFFPKRLAVHFIDIFIGDFANKKIAEVSYCTLKMLGKKLNNWRLYPNATKGFRVAEVCNGGVLLEELFSKTFECKNQQGLYFIGESVDITGWLGGYNFAWAWASGFACGNNL